MTNVAEGETAKTGREDILERYVTFYKRLWSEGGVRVCEDTQLMDQARQAVLTPCGEVHTFTLLPFYPSVINIISSHSNSNTSSASLLQRLSKAFEVLELYCHNLFLFPWKKEFKTLKKFTGHFVYHIKAILPLQLIQTILRLIGYDCETDTEYKISENVDSNQAKEMGFELFLARIECEYLIQLTSEMSHTECLKIIQNRGPSVTLHEEPQLEITSNGVLEEEKTHRGNVLLSPEPSLKPLDREMNERQKPEPGSFLSEDKSILEMQKDYPDLAIRQRPIFRSSSAKVNRSGGREVKFNRDVSSPQSITVHAEASEPAPEPPSSEEQQLRVGAASHTPGLKHTDEASLTDLAEMMDNLKLKDFPGEEHLKCPVEETAPCKKETIQILCSPSHKSVCNITGCGSCSTSNLRQHHDIMEPPQSFYIPNRVSGSAQAHPVEHDENSS